MIDFERAVVAGNYLGGLFGGYVVRSRSDPGRAIVPLMNGAKIVPAETMFESAIGRLRRWGMPIQHSCYPCLFGFEDGDSSYIVSGNAVFDEAIISLICRKEGVSDAVMTALEAPDPMPEEPRLFALVQEDMGSHRFVFGSYRTGTDMAPKITSTALGANRAAYLSEQSGGTLTEISLEHAPSQLARYLYETIFGNGQEGGIGAATCLCRPRGLFNIDIFNAKG